MVATAGASADLMLQRYLDGVIEPKQCYKLKSSIISTEMKLLEATGKRPETLTKLYNCLSSIKPTSVESERAFSCAGNFISKIRARITPSTLNLLVFLKDYFKRL